MSQELVNQAVSLKQSFEIKEDGLYISNCHCFRCKDLRVVKVKNTSITPRNKSNYQLTATCQTCGVNVSTLASGKNEVLKQFIEKSSAVQQ